MNKKQVYYEDVESGLELPSLTKLQTQKRFVRYARASGDLAEAHYNYEVATSRGLPNTVAQGLLTTGYIDHMLTDWYTPDGFLRNIKVQYRHYTVPGDVLTIKGVVTKKYKEDGQYLVACDVWAENQEGRKVTIGTAIVSLPSRDNLV